MHVWKIDTSVNFENIMARSIIDKALITIDAIIQWTNYRKLFFIETLKNSVSNFTFQELL